MNIETKVVGALKGYKFFVPSYQRGYRWGDFEIKALLNDILEFQDNNETKKYYIQPLIVKKREDGSFEVVDGQQRLTTLYIFMKIVEQEIRSDVPLFELVYQTRRESEAFLKSLSDRTEPLKSNIDFYYISRAYKTIDAWLEEQEDKSVAIQKMNSKIRTSVSFIWYELSSESSPIEVFTKVNLGRIPLTNAELIKALFLNQDYFLPSVSDRENRQMEVSLEWERIEQGLQNDSFWYFLSEKSESGTRIDFLFELLADEYNKELKISKQQKYFPFLVFSSYLADKKEKQKYIKEIWDKIKSLYEEFYDWYMDLNKYHIIGYLIACGKNMHEICALTRNKRKSEIDKALLEAIKKQSSWNESNLHFIRNEFLTSSHKKKIRNLLFLFNIATLVCKSEKQYRFPFDIYKKEGWDIEHIHATADKTNEADDNIGNLALLDCHTNRSYKNETFLEKRRVILEREANGQFVPICTKNVFLKVYTNDMKQEDIQLWGEKDKKEYIDAMIQLLNIFFEGGRL